MIKGIVKPRYIILSRNEHNLGMCFENPVIENAVLVNSWKEDDTYYWCALINIQNVG